MPSQTGPGAFSSTRTLVVMASSGSTQLPTQIAQSEAIPVVVSCLERPIPGSFPPTRLFGNPEAQVAQAAQCQARHPSHGSGA